MGLIEFFKEFYEDDYHLWLDDGGDDIIDFVKETKSRMLARLDEWAEEHQLNDPAIMYKRKTEQDMINLFKQIINKAFGGRNERKF